MREEKKRSLPSLDCLTAALLICVLLAVLFSNREFWSVGGDSQEYLELADGITSLAILNPPADMESALVKRTPGFPLLLLAGKSVFSGELTAALRSVNTLLFLCASLTTIYLLRPLLPLSATALALWLPFIGMKLFFNGFMSEWTSLCLLLIVFALMYRWARTRSPAALAQLAFVHSYLVLVHPAFLPSLMLTAALGFFTSPRLKALLLFVPAIAPLILWCGLNYYRFQKFSVTPYTEKALFCMAGMIGEAPVEPGDSEAFRNFAEAARQTPKAGNEQLREAKNISGQPELTRLYLEQARFLDRYSAASGWSIEERQDVLRTYASRAFQHNLGKYVDFVGYNLQSMNRTWLLVGPLAAAFGLFYWKTGRNGALGAALIWFLGLHLLHIVPPALLSPALGRYYSTSYYPLLFAISIAGLHLALGIFTSVGASSRPLNDRV